MDCFLCQDNDDLIVGKFQYWTLLLHPNQSYLGRCMLKLNRHIVDYFDTTDDERAEMHDVVKKIRDVLMEEFSPDIFNYAFLGNEINHLHLHIVPRYQGERKFLGHTFKDDRWGHNFSHLNDVFDTPQEIFEDIRRSLAKYFSKFHLQP